MIMVLIEVVVVTRIMIMRDDNGTDRSSSSD